MDFIDPKLFLNRELSWLEFNERVLAEARDASLPVYERLKFLGISSSNLDEFFMVRVAGLKQQLAIGVAETAADGMLPADQLAAISERCHAMVAEQYRIWNEELKPLLAQHGIAFVSEKTMTADQRAAARQHFTHGVFPALTPLAVDPGHPFPHLRNKSINIALILQKDGRRRKGEPKRENALAVVQVPSVMSRLVPLPAETGTAYVMLGDLIAMFAGDLFPGHTVKQTARFRVTRNWDLNLDEEESEDLLSTIQEELRRRDRGNAVRLEIDEWSTPAVETALAAALKLGTSDVYRVQGPLQISDLSALADLDPRPELKAEPLVPSVSQALRDAESLFPLIAEKDILLHHPYEAFDPVVRFLNEAAEDPNVLAIKQTLYRISGDSPIARALQRAAENGKQVAVLVELKARLDEANNIAWARRLEEAGVHVVYGLIGLKTHCKVLLVVRREKNGIRRYVHLGTGNYNHQTARQYTDLSLFTARSEVSEDVTDLFNMLTGYADPPRWKKLAVAPLGLQQRVVELIERESQKARRNEPARIVAKLNALVDPVVIRTLYAASQAGVEIELLVRGICCLRPGVPGVSENIRVTSIVDRFLEHSRVFAFGVGSGTEVYFSSADWMPRNFHRRIEIMHSIEDPAIRERILGEVLGVALKDNLRARRLQTDGSYMRVPSETPEVRCQMVLLDTARRAGEPRPVVEPILRHAAAPAADTPAEPSTPPRPTTLASTG